MSLFSILNTGAKGLVASQTSAQLAGQNVSNVGSAGYTRRSTNVTPGVTDDRQPAGRRVVDQFVEKRLLSAQSSHADASAESFAVAALDTAFMEDGHGLGDALDTFQAAVQSLAGKPDDPATRTAAIAASTQLASAFHRTAAVLDSARQDANHRIVDDVKLVNSRLKEIGKLNADIRKNEANGSEASDLRDQRDALVREVAEKVPVTVVENSDGEMSLLLNGSQALVGPDGSVHELGLSFALNGDVTVTKQAAGQTVDVTRQITSGSIGGEIRARDGAISGAIQNLDQLAYDMTSKYNSVHQAGIGLDGVSGRDMFTQMAGVSGAANGFSVSSDVLSNPSALATGTDPNELPADNTNALALADVASNSLTVGGTTANEALAALVSSVGFSVQSAAYTESFTSDALAQVEGLHDSVSGVSSDEEMVALMSYQRAYQASLKVVQLADEMLGDLMALRR